MSYNKTYSKVDTKSLSNTVTQALTGLNKNSITNFSTYFSKRPDKFSKSVVRKLNEVNSKNIVLLRSKLTKLSNSVSKINTYQRYESELESYKSSKDNYKSEKSTYKWNHSDIKDTPEYNNKINFYDNKIDYYDDLYNSKMSNLEKLEKEIDSLWG